MAAVKHVLKMEGGYVNHPNDPGGETNYGISKRSYPLINIKELTEAEAIAIYHEDFWLPIAARVMDVRLRMLAFDSAVNHGLGRAIEWLQSYDTFESYLTKRIRFYTDLGTFDTFGRGWMRRVAHIVEAASRMTNDLQYADVVIDHRPSWQRVATAVTGKYGPVKFRLRKLTDGDGTKLDIANDGR